MKNPIQQMLFLSFTMVLVLGGLVILSEVF